MCGIVGIAGRFAEEQLTTAVKSMNAALSHRGPDDEGAWVGRSFAFGMRRLSIIDLSGGHQPMWDSQTGIGMVYNGEVYNYKDIRAGLEREGVRFQTSSDTEVVLKGLAHKGVEAVHGWNGMFAVGLWNDRDKKLLLIRDRVGVKPLYYYWDGKTFLFASEIKALLASNLVPRQLNRQAVWDYLTYRYVPGPQTMWHNVWKLPPGHFLEWTPEKDPRLHRYWSSDVVSENETVDITEKTKQFERLFLSSVEQRLLASDVPVGVMLSGGLDSSAIAAAAVELGHKQFHTFSVGFSEGGEFSELSYARHVARHLGVQHHEVVVDQSNFLETLPQAVRATDEPLADLTIVPLLAVCRLAREQVKVVLSGEGADEILAGYNFEVSYDTFQRIQRIQRLPSSVLKSVSRLIGLISSTSAEKIERAGNIPLSKWNVAHNAHITWYWESLAKKQLWPAFDGMDSGRILQDMYSAAGSQNPLDQLLSVYQKSWLVEDLLMKADKMSMAASLELRVPFLDYRLVEWANRQPVDVKIGYLDGRYVTKHVLRRFAQSRLPAEIIQRPKLGFPVPVNRWLQQEQFSRWAKEHLVGSESRLKNLFEPLLIEQQLGQAAAGDVMAANRCWLLIVLETWLREFGVEIDPAAEAPLPPAAALAAG